ncbi:MAG: NAD(P)H-dependent oxidoreductase subunit E [Clostridiales bacterium]|nr:NAD(P)H-dependent oxidoreductase subunit E [Clostridiales bacterium]
MMDVKEVLDKYGNSPGRLLGAMLEYQRSKPQNYLTEEEIKAFAKETGLPVSRVYSLVTFYSLFSEVPRGKYIVQVCHDVPCHVNGSVNVVAELEKLLGIKMGETTDDGLFTLEYTSCIGCCEMAPAMQIGETVYGNLTPEKIASIIEELRRAGK